MARPLRTVVVTTSFPTYDGDPSGHFVRSHCRKLADQGSDVHVIVPSGARPHANRSFITRSAISEPHLTIHVAGGGDLFAFPGAVARARENPLRLLGATTFAIGTRRCLDALRPFDQLVAHWIFPSAWPLCMRIPASLDVVAHGADVRFLSVAPGRDAIVRSLLDRGGRFQFVAAHLLDTLAARLPIETAIRLRKASRIEPAPIELPDVRIGAAKARASLDLNNDDVVAVCVGRLIPDKRIELAISAAALARVHLVIVGDGPERERLESLARSKGARIKWTGAIDRREALAWIAAADVLVHPSANEGAPTVVREARALGAQVVGCAAGDIARWARTDAGIHVTNPDAQSIARKISAIARSHIAIKDKALDIP